MMGTKAKQNLLRFKQGVLSLQTVRELTEKKGLKRLFILDCDRDDYLTGNGEGWEYTSTGNLSFDSITSFRGDQEMIPPVVLTACGRGESSWEDTVCRQGFFAEAFVDVLNSHKLSSFSEFWEQLQSNMENLGIPGSQTPSFYGDLSSDIPFWPFDGSDEAHSEPVVQSDFNTMKDMILAKAAVQALKIYRLEQQAINGDSVAALELGGIFERGDCVPQNSTLCAKWYRVSAELGNASAQCLLAFMYSGGNGVKHDDKEAAFWFLKAAEQGITAAQYNLGFLYLSGRGVSISKDKSEKWFRQAAIQYGKQAENGDQDAQKTLAWMYQSGYGMKRDSAEAVRWYRKAAEQGHAQAQYMLGCMYDESQGMIGNDEEAVKWYRKAAARGHAGAIQNLMKVEQRLKMRD